MSNVITQINYCPRSGFESRMVGGIFQGANQAGFSDAVTLATVTTQPATGVFTSASVANAAAFRYVRYLSPNGGWGNVAELEFYGYASAIPGTPTARLMSMAVAGTSFAFSWPLTNAGFTLQWSTNLVSPNWLNVTSAVPHMVGNQWQVTLPPPGNGAPVFYRLSK